MWVAFAKASHIFFSKNISVYAIFNDQSFNDTLTNDIVSSEQLGPDVASTLIRSCNNVMTLYLPLMWRCNNGMCPFGYIYEQKRFCKEAKADLNIN